MKNKINEVENKIVNCIEKDTISRNKSLFNFIKMVSKLNDNEIIAINGGWGTGKTIFAKQMEIIINYANNINESGDYINEDLKTNKLLSINKLEQKEKEALNKIINENNIRTYFNGNQTNCLYFNAWEYDDNDNPILSIVYKLINDFPYLCTKFTKVKQEKFISILDTVSVCLSKGTIKVSDYVNTEDLVERIITSEELKEKINQLFDNLLVENSNKMILIIDELDRCKPTYAIKLLEEIKHYITNKNIIVILTTNIYQLSNTIKNLYGYNFDIDEYLDKIIDITISLKPVNKIEYIKNIALSNYSNRNRFSDAVKAYCLYRKLEMRSINRFIRIMSFYENYMNDKNRRKKRTDYLFEYIFLPYCLGEQIFNSTNYNSFIKGTGYEEFYKYIMSDDNLIEIIERCIFNSTRKEERNIELEIKKIYNGIYNSTKEYESFQVGEETIDSYDTKYFLDLCTMLNDYNLE